MSGIRDEDTDPHYREIPMGDDMPTRLGDDARKQADSAMLVVIAEKTGSLDGRVEQLDRHLVAHNEVVRTIGLAQLFWLRVLVVGLLIEFGGLLTVIVGGIVATLLR